MESRTIKDLSGQLCRELELRREPSKTSSGRALLISWAEEPSSAWDEVLDDLRCILRDEYHYTVERLHLSGSAQHDLQSKALDLLEQSETSKKPAVIFYHGDICIAKGGIDWIS